MQCLHNQYRLFALLLFFLNNLLSSSFLLLMKDKKYGFGGAERKKAKLGDKKYVYS
jgi:hypothetical protein